MRKVASPESQVVVKAASFFVMSIPMVKAMPAEDIVVVHSLGGTHYERVLPLADFQLGWLMRVY